MEWVRDESTWEHLLASKCAVLFVFVDWSIYAHRGLKFFEMVEQICVERLPEPLSFFACDASSIDTLPRDIENWIRREDAQGKLHLLPAIAVGNGSIVWTHRGHAVSFEMSMLHLGVDKLLEKSRQARSALNGA